MTVKKALLIGFSLAIAFIVATLIIGHLWAFIILIIAALIGIAISIINTNEKSNDRNNDEYT